MEISELHNFHHFTIRIHQIELTDIIQTIVSLINGISGSKSDPDCLIAVHFDYSGDVQIFLSFAESPTFRLPLRSTDWRFAGFTFDYALFYRERYFAMGSKYPFYVLLILGLIDLNLMPAKSSKISVWPMVGKKFESHWRPWIFRKISTDSSSILKLK